MIVATDCNFSMAVAHHAVELKIPVFVIMPSCCSSPRLRIYRDYGAMVISYGSTGHDSQNHACHLAKENGYLYLEESVPLMLALTFHTEVTTCLSAYCTTSTDILFEFTCQGLFPATPVPLVLLTTPIYSLIYTYREKNFILRLQILQVIITGLM